MLKESTRQSLTNLFEKRQVATDPAELVTYEVDAGFDYGKPDGVFYPNNAEDVSRIMQWATEYGVPLIARGAGTGLSGGAVAEYGGVILEFARMNRILDMDVVGRTAVVEPGVVNQMLDTEAKQHGLYFPPDPASGRASTLGGNIGENAGGPHCFKYGVTTNYVTGIELVLSNGQILQLGGRALDYPEYDLCALAVGNEGTLGIITKADVRLIRNPPTVKTLMISFKSIQEAGKAVSAVIAAGLMPATLEMMDQKIMGMIEAYIPAGLPIEAEAALIVEVDGYPDGLDSQMEEVADILVDNGGYDLRLAQTEEARQKIWYGRKSAAGAMSRIAPAYYLTDVTVPRSHLAEMMTEVNKICELYQLQVGHVFHAGDGNLHPALLCDRNDADLMKRVYTASKEIVQLCIERDGSITGEHGVGIEKRPYMDMMFNGAEMATLYDIKEIFDPANLLNPGKIFPEKLPKLERTPAQMPTSNVVAPSTAEEAAAGLAALTEAKQNVQIVGSSNNEGGTDGVSLSTANLTGIHRFAPEDLYITVGAGMPLSEIQNFLRVHQMQVPLTSPWADASVGGIVATNLNAPLRIRYGSLRDIMLSATVAMADGRVIRTGRPVVKNVAGYDLSKLFVGSYGTLGLLTDVTFKLIPLPRSQRSLAIPVDTFEQGLALARQVLPHSLVASAVVLAQGIDVPGLLNASYTLLYTAEGIAEDVDAELGEVAEVLQGADGNLSMVTSESAHFIAGTSLWSQFIGETDADEMLVRVGIPVKELVAYREQLPKSVEQDSTLFIDCASGMIYAKYSPDDAVDAGQWLDSLRQPALEMGGYAAVMTLPKHLVNDVDRWGYQPDGIALMRGLKERWDPAGILNPGTFIVG